MAVLLLPNLPRFYLKFVESRLPVLLGQTIIKVDIHRRSLRIRCRWRFSFCWLWWNLSSLFKRYLSRIWNVPDTERICHSYTRWVSSVLTSTTGIYEPRIRPMRVYAIDCDHRSIRISAVVRLCALGRLKTEVSSVFRMDCDCARIRISIDDSANLVVSRSCRAAVAR